MVDNKLAITYFGRGYYFYYLLQMISAKSALITFGLLLISSFSIQAQEARQYSTEGYCILAYEQVDPDYLKVYERKLGFRPKLKLCNRVNRLVTEFQPSSWNYQFGSPYPGSSIYLTPEQVNMIKSAKEQFKHVKR
jgi:hypothetical protein